MQKIKAFAKDHPMLTLLAAILVTALAVYNFYVFRGGIFIFEDIGSDTKEQYVMFYNLIAAKLRSGDFSPYCLNFGFGTSVYTLNLYNPTLVLLYIAGAVLGPQHIASCLIFIHILHILLAGWACFLFLGEFDISLKSRIIAAYIYSFNGFITVWGQHYNFGIAATLLPLLLFLIEASFKGGAFTGSASLSKKQSTAFILIPIVSGIACLSSYYFAYMILAATGLYIVFRLLYTGNVSVFTKVRAFIARCGLLIIGIFIGMIYILPSYALTAGTSTRLSSDSSLISRLVSGLALYPFEYYKTFLKKLASGSLQGVGYTPDDYSGYMNYYEAPQLFMTALAVILALQFIIYLPKILRSKRQRIMSVIAVLFVFFLCFIQDGSLIFNGFMYPFSRHTFVLMPVMALLIAVTLDYLIRERKFSVAGGLAACAFYLFICLRSVPSLPTRPLKMNAVVIAASAVLIVLCLILITRTKLNRRVLTAGLCLLIFVQIFSDASATVVSRGYLCRGYSYFEELYGEKVDAVKEYLAEDQELYRLEKDYMAGSSWMDSLAMNYNGISVYNSTLNSDVVNFVTQTVPEMKYYGSDYRLSFRYITGRTDIARLMGIRYILSKDPDAVFDGYEQAAVFDDIYLYEDKDVSFAKFYPAAISVSEFEARKAEDASRISSLLTDYLILPDQAVSAALAESAQAVSETSGSSEQGVSSTTYGSAQAAGASAEMTRNGSDAHLSCLVSAPSDGYVFFPIPYEAGWTVSVDNKKAEIIKADYGFMAVKLSSGSHEILLDYTQPYLFEGCIITVTGLVVWLFLFIYLRKKRSPKA